MCVNVSLASFLGYINPMCIVYVFFLFPKYYPLSHAFRRRRGPLFISFCFVVAAIFVVLLCDWILVCALVCVFFSLVCAFQFEFFFSIINSRGISIRKSNAVCFRYAT